MELMRWSTLVEDYGVELRKGSPETPATDVFSATEEGEKRWKDLKNRVVEHVRTRQLAGSHFFFWVVLELRMGEFERKPLLLSVEGGMETRSHASLMSLEFTMPARLALNLP